ncbi:YfkD family protein [Metabacillus sp. KIGAM252]|uniref:YfkD family protein n=1 Tax=Metabacillus flavus TaxID=2823519 RepID=A0ABS5LAK9_9BACI|nr:YfkD family protein [Metabacillus flavus]
MKMKRITICVAVLLSVCFSSIYMTEAKTKIPSSVLDISKENTYPNPAQNLPYLQPSELARELSESSTVPIENPNLIKQLNETTISDSPLAVGYRATIYLGRWALNYESSETTPHWEYQRINSNLSDNRGGKAAAQIHYKQNDQKKIRGGLTSEVPMVEDVKNMMLLKAMKKTNLPLSFETIIGSGTKKDQIYNVPVKKMGYLYAYAPAISEKGKVTYGEVYLELKGNKRKINVKNITSQGIGAWIPVQDHLSFGYMVSDRPR